MKRILLSAALCFTLTCLPAAYTIERSNPVVRAIERAADTSLQYQFASAKRDPNTTFLCLIVGEKLKKDAATQALNRLMRRMSQAVPDEDRPLQKPEWTVFLKLEGLSNVLKKPTIEMHIKGRNTVSSYSVLKPLYCYLDHSRAPGEQIKLWSCPNGRWYSDVTIKKNAIGFLVDPESVEKTLTCADACPIL